VMGDHETSGSCDPKDISDDMMEEQSGSCDLNYMYNSMMMYGPSALSKAREDDERHQESRQDRPDQIMLQQVGAIRGTANKLCFVFSYHGKAKINFAPKVVNPGTRLTYKRGSSDTPKGNDPHILFSARSNPKIACRPDPTSNLEPSHTQ
nr:hypothetical protein [Tanacetum cinerariifolium]